ncbi:hypothetical protein SAVCW2_44530 [Streptomyces avermitilis]|nr:hypothetical protein SAVCW2_44530 [Streptomyces avermitilis]
MGKRRRAAERNRSGRPLVIGGLIAVVAVGGAVGAYSLYGSGAAAEERASQARHRAVKTGPLSATEIRTTATEFLNAWQRGKVTGAAAATDDSAAARTALTGYTKDAHITDVTLTRGKRSGRRSRSPSRRRCRTRAGASRSRTSRS